MRNLNRIFILPTALGALGLAALVPGDARAASSAEMDAPTTLTLGQPGDPGQPLRISGWVRDSSGNPIAGATVYVRQTDDSGTYTAQYQGSLKTDKDGRYRLVTVLPGNYYRAKHIHIGAVHDGYEFLETEILFKGDLNLDPETQEKYAIHLEEASVKDKKVLFGRFDMVLRRIGSD
jgi:protocatechuate 3,4-dioxygenase beta subunit